MSRAIVDRVMDQYDSLTILLRDEAEDEEYSTEEVSDVDSFAEDVLDESVAMFYPLRNSHVRGSGWLFYTGTDGAEYDNYIVSKTPSNWTAFGCDESDFESIYRSFEDNPFLIERES